MARTAHFLEKEFLSGNVRDTVQLEEVQDDEPNELMNSFDTFNEQVELSNSRNSLNRRVGLLNSRVSSNEQVELTNSAGSLQEVDPPFMVDPILDPRSTVDETPEEVPTLRRSNRTRHVPDRWYGESFLIEDDEPYTYGAAMKGPDSESWLEAMKSEIDSMYQNDV